MASDFVFARETSVDDSDWESLYCNSFRQEQRTSVEKLRDAINCGRLILHTTSDDEQGLLCFSLTSVHEASSLLNYLATDQSKQSRGTGSKHVKSLIAELRQNHPNLLGLFAEIDSSREEGIAEEIRKERKRRLEFYRRLSFKGLKQKYFMPNFNKDAPDIEGELLWYEFGGPVSAEKIPEIIREIYTLDYRLPVDDPRVLALKKPSDDELVEEAT